MYCSTKYTVRFLWKQKNIYQKQAACTMHHATCPGTKLDGCSLVSGAAATPCSVCAPCSARMQHVHHIVERTVSRRYFLRAALAFLRVCSAFSATSWINLLAFFAFAKGMYSRLAITTMFALDTETPCLSVAVPLPLQGIKV